MRPLLQDAKIENSALKSMASYHSNIVQEVKDAAEKNEWLIVGMRTNPVCKKARKILDSKNVKYHYVEYGSYMSMWKERLAIKLWSGWPTFPQVFHKGKLIGGASDLKQYLG